MPNKPYTFPNQRMIKIHREPVKSDFLGIKNDNWQAASKLLGPHALRLYLYLAANADKYVMALSPAAIEREIGMPRSTYHDQFRKLINQGYILDHYNNRYSFYETPRDNEHPPIFDGWSGAETLDLSGQREYHF